VICAVASWSLVRAVVAYNRSCPSCKALTLVSFLSFPASLAQMGDMQFAEKFLSQELIDKLVAQGFKSQQAFFVQEDTKEAFVEHLTRQVLKMGDEGTWRFQPVACSIRAMLEHLSPAAARAAAAPARVSKEGDEEEDKKLKRKRKREELRQRCKAKFESSYAGSLWGSDRLAPSDEALERCTWQKGDPPEWEHWCHFTSVEEVHQKELEKKAKKEAEEKTRKDKGRKRKHQGDSSEDETDKVLEFGGGLWKAQLACELRRKVCAGKDLVHLEALATYDMNLFDAALRTPPEGFRHPSPDELLKADKAAWEEVARLVRAKEASVEAGLIHVSKPGGFLWGLVRPREKAKSAPSGARPSIGGGAWKGQSWEARDWKPSSWKKEDWKGGGNSSGWKASSWKSR
jgi:hypothetical protein